jgi:hypothetical protein
VAGRASVWSDPRVIELTAKFVPATDEVFRLQRGSDAECVFFQEMAEHGHYGGRPGTTRQGIYVCSPSGTFLASINSNNADRVLEMLRRGLEAWEQLPDADRQLAAENRVKPTHRWEDSYPTDGLVLTVITRDLPLECDPSAPCEVKWNQDHVWFSKGEAKQWLGDDPREGDIHRLPDELVSRLVRFHLVDAVKGQTSTFSPAAVDESHISTEVLERRGSLVKLKITGSTKGTSPGGWWDSPNGVATRLLGAAMYDLEKNCFTEFEIVALGRRWGQTRFNGRRRDPQSGPLGYVFRLAASNAVPIAPGFIAAYDADWVIGPQRP